MNEKIKFRAWDKIKNDMWKVETLYIEDQYCALFKDTIYGITAKIKNSRLNLMQYTGLKDKNGVEIYEGDIVKIEKEIFKIYWHDGHAGFWIERIGRPMEGTWNMYYVSANGEVIGNIYENPELLN
jgi:uncharacterized phage protein (TIGR01671 family)